MKQRNISKDTSIQRHCCENCKSCTGRSQCYVSYVYCEQGASTLQIWM